jgi:hypothetical protein
VYRIWIVRVRGRGREDAGRRGSSRQTESALNPYQRGNFDARQNGRQYFFEHLKIKLFRKN